VRSLKMKRKKGGGGTQKDTPRGVTIEKVKSCREGEISSKKSVETSNHSGSEVRGKGKKMRLVGGEKPALHHVETVTAGRVGLPKGRHLLWPAISRKKAKKRRADAAKPSSSGVQQPSSRGKMKTKGREPDRRR